VSSRGNFPSAEARAFLADPINRDTRVFDPIALPVWRRDRRSESEARAERIAKLHGVTLEWQRVAGVRSLIITPSGWRGESQILYLFGGAFIMGGPLEDLVISAALATGTGMQVVSPAYALAPEAPFPAGLNDSLTVAQAIRPLAIAGESAGGNLALSVARTLISEGCPVAALALLSPAADMSADFDPFDGPDDPTLFPPLVAEMPEIYAPNVAHNDPSVSPIHGTFSQNWPPTIITTGTRDLFASICQRLAGLIGNKATLRVWDDMWHVFEYYDGIPESAVSLKEISEFLRANCEGTA